MNSKRAGVSFLLQIIAYYILVVGLAIYYGKNPEAEEAGIVENLIFAQLMNLLPVLLVILIGYRKRPRERFFGDILGFRRIKPSTAGMAVLYAFLLLPLSTLANAISMIFVDNTVAALAGDILEVPFFAMFLIMAVIGPFCEEAVFRGAFYRGFRKSGNIFGAVILSAVLFALMHMNFNQAAYAVLLGIMLALIAEATGSTTASFIVHFVFNGQSVCLMYLEKAFFPEALEKELAESALVGEELALVISVYLFLTVVCTSIAFCVLTWIARNEGKQNFLRTVWESRKVRREKLWSIWLILGIVLAVIYMVFEALLMYFMS